MKDILDEVLKMEVKILSLSSLQDYYKGKITYLQHTDNVQRYASTAKAIKEEADVKPNYRTELEGHEYPLNWFLTEKVKRVKKN